jgi:hypothetical protein
VLYEARCNHARVFQASTNGVPEIHPQRENYRGAVSPIGPRTCYDEGKRWRRGALLRLPPHHGVERAFSIHATALARLDAYDFIAARDPAARPAA